MSQTGDSLPRHGGDLAFATARLGLPVDGWLDLSTGINPHSYPLTAIPPRLFVRLPDRGEIDALIAAAKRAYDVPERVKLIASPGSEIALRLIPLVAPRGAVVVVGPTYGSHVDAWRNFGRAVIEVASVDSIPGDVRFVIVGNPNNPDGRTTGLPVLADLARRLGANDGFLIVDEAFADTAPEISLIPHLAELPAVVLRSFGKFYGLAGVRLGFVVGPPDLLARLAAVLGDWPVSGPAVAIGQAALADHDWRIGERYRLKDEVNRLRDLLSRYRLAIRGGTDLFLLVEDISATAIHVSLAERGIWTRAFAEGPTWLRFGLPPEGGFARLDRAFSEFR